MVLIFLHDTGKYTTSSSSGVTGSANVANNGDEFPLKIRSMRFATGLTFDNNPSPASYTYPKLAFVSFPSPTIVLTGHIKKNADVSSATSTMYKLGQADIPLTDESGTDTNYEVKCLGIMEHMSRTKGYKELYYKSNTTDNIFFGMIPSTQLETSGTYRCFRVRVKGLDITETPDSSLTTWTCTLEVTA